MGEGVTKRTGCSNQVADWALWSQLFLYEMRKECPGWNTTHRQEWSLLLLEQMFHNTVAMWHKDVEIDETAPKHSIVWALVGSWDSQDPVGHRANLWWWVHGSTQCVHLCGAGRFYEEAVVWTLQMHDQSWPMEQKGATWVTIQKLEALLRPGWRGSGLWVGTAEQTIQVKKEMDSVQGREWVKAMWKPLPYMSKPVPVPLP